MNDIDGEVHGSKRASIYCEKSQDIAVTTLPEVNLLPKCRKNIIDDVEDAPVKRPIIRVEASR